MVNEQVFKQSLIPSLISLIGLIFTSIILAKLELSKTPLGLPFHTLDQLTVLVPVLNNLSGNFQLNLSCRMGTAANSNKLNASNSRYSILKSNIAFMAIQSVLIGAFCACWAITVGGLVHIWTSLYTFLVLTAATILTSLFCAVILSAFIFSIITFSITRHIDPDNIAAPIATALGDATTIISFTLFTNLLLLDSTGLLSLTILLGTISIGLYSLKYFPTMPHLHPYDVWTHLTYIICVVITTISGIALDKGIGKYNGIASVSPVINGICGGNMAILASRMTTAIQLKQSESSSFKAIWALTTINVVILIAIEMVFRITKISFRLIIAAFVTFNVLLYLLYKGLRPLCEYLNKYAIDLDSTVLPILAAMGDLGTLVYIAVQILEGESW